MAFSLCARARERGAGGAMIWHPDIPESFRNSIVTGDARILAKSLPDESVDLIFTDPPYLKADLPIYSWLASESARVLKPGGFLLTMVNGLALDQIYAMLSADLTYFWTYQLFVSGSKVCVVWPHGNTRAPVISRVKPVVAYSKGVSFPERGTMGLVTGGGIEKRYHRWGQDENSARYFVEMFSRPEGVVWEPFAGGGTTPAVCHRIRRNCVAFEMDPETAILARERVRLTPEPLFVLDEPLPTRSLFAELLP